MKRQQGTPLEIAEARLAKHETLAERFAENHGESSPSWTAMVADDRAEVEALRNGTPVPAKTLGRGEQTDVAGIERDVIEAGSFEDPEPVREQRHGNGSGNGHTVTHVRAPKPPVETDPNLVPSLDEIRALRDQLDRKFEATDMNPGLRAAAVTWLLGEKHDVSTSVGKWLVDVAMKVAGAQGRGGISDGQAKGVLNCMTAKRGNGLATAPAAAPTNAVTEPGMYGKDGAIYKVKRSRSTGNLYAERALEEGGFAYDKGAIYKLSADDKLSLEQAAEFGQRTGVCCVCGATLTDPKSIAAGIGPICAKGF